MKVVRTNDEGRIAIVVFSYYPHDLRIRRAAEAAARAGFNVEVYCLRQGAQQKAERTPGLTVYRFGVLRTRSNRLNYIVEYLSFLLIVLVRLSARHLLRRYAWIHVNNMPDVLVFTGLMAKLTGAKILLDLHDPMPEVFMTKYGLRERDLFVRVLIALERASIRFADRVVTTNIAFRDLFVRRDCPPEKIEIVMNTPDEVLFKPDFADCPEGAKDHRKAFKVVFNGTVVQRHGLDIAIDAVQKLTARIPGIVFEIYGEGDYVDALRERIRSQGGAGVVAYKGFVHIDELIEIIRGADVGVIPNIRSVFTEINFPVRIFEYLSLGRPIIAPNTRGIRDYFDSTSLLLFEPGSSDDLAEKIHFVYAHPSEARQIVLRGRDVYARHSWATQKEVLLGIYRRGRLTAFPRRSAAS